jgi:hypothetical protein
MPLFEAVQDAHRPILGAMLASTDSLQVLFDQG